MIRRISGTLDGMTETAALVAVGGITYEVMVPASLRGRLRAMAPESEVTFHVHHYLEGGMGGGPLVPRLVGFLEEAERDFFLKYTDVDGLGLKTALRSLEEPVREVAAAIEREDKGFLRKLPGIGPRLADKVVAELKGKVARWALLKDQPGVGGAAAPAPTGIEAEAVAALVGLQYGATEAQALVRAALTRLPAPDSLEALIQEIFRQRSGRP